MIIMYQTKPENNKQNEINKTETNENIAFLHKKINDLEKENTYLLHLIQKLNRIIKLQSKL